MGRKSHKRDVARTRLFRFGDKRSYVTVAGKVFLFGRDKTELREACFARDGYTCQLTGVRVTWESGEMDHILAYSKGGDDTLSNVRTVAKGPHQRRHPEKFGRAR